LASPTAICNLEESQLDKESDAIAPPPSSAAPITERDRASYDGNRPLHEIEEEIARTRVRLSATIEAFERQLATGRAIDNAAEMVRRALEPPPTSSLNRFQAYAIPLALIASGLGWLFMLRRRNGQSGSHTVRDETPTEAAEMGETPPPEPLYVNIIDPLEPVSSVDEKQ
jgi:hypothetical protein